MVPLSEQNVKDFILRAETRLSAADQMSVLDPWTFGWSVLGVELPKAKVVLLSLLLRSSIIRPSLSCNWVTYIFNLNIENGQ